MKVGLIGRTHFLLEAAQKLVKEGVDVPFVYTMKSESYYRAHPNDFEGFARNIGSQYFCGPQLISMREQIARLGAQVVISMNWGALIPSPVLKSFPLGIINAHAGDLPRYKGNACPNWAILNNESHVTMTTHLMTEELDSGPILMQQRFPLTRETYITDSYEWFDEIIPKLLCDSALGLLRNTLIPRKQDPGIRSLRAFPRRPDDAKIDWRSSAQEILALIRASSRPFMGAFSFLEGVRKVIIWRAAIYEPKYDYLAVPGQVCLSSSGCPVIATGDGMLVLQDCSVDSLSHIESSKIILRSLRNRFIDK